MSKITAAITGVCGYLPEEVVTNEDLSKIRRHFRRVDHFPHRNQGTPHYARWRPSPDMATEAVKGLLKKDGIPIRWTSKLVILATVTPDYPFPSTANVVCDKVGMTNAWGL